MNGRETVGSIDIPSDSGSGDDEGPKLIQCVDGQETQIHEVWTFCENSVMHEFHPTSRLDLGAGFVGEFATD